MLTAECTDGFVNQTSDQIRYSPRVNPSHKEVPKNSAKPLSTFMETADDPRHE